MTGRYILSIDQASVDMGWAILYITPDVIKVVSSGVHHSSPSLPNGVRYREKCEFIKYICGKMIKAGRKISAIVYEEVPEEENYLKTRDVLNQVLGCVMMTISEMNPSVYESKMNVNNWKSKAGIRSKTRDLQKQEGIDRVFDIFGISVLKDDESDAIMMGLSSYRQGLYQKIIEHEEILLGIRYKNGKIKKKLWEEYYGKSIEKD